MSFTASIGNASAIATLFSPFTSIATFLYGEKIVPFAPSQFQNPIEVNQTFNVFDPEPEVSPIEPEPEFIFIEPTVEENPKAPLDLNQFSEVERGLVFRSNPELVCVEPEPKSTIDNTTITPAEIPAGFELVTVDGREFLVWVDTHTNSQTITDKLVNGLINLLIAFDNYIGAPFQNLYIIRTPAGWILSAYNFYCLMKGLLTSRHKLKHVVLPYLLSWAPSKTVTAWVFCIAKILLFWMRFKSNEQIERTVKAEVKKETVEVKKEMAEVKKETAKIKAVCNSLYECILWVWQEHEALKIVVGDIIIAGIDLRGQVHVLNVWMNAQRPGEFTPVAQGQDELD